MSAMDSHKEARSPLSAAKRALLLHRLQLRGNRNLPDSTLNRRPDTTTAPLSSVQEQMWFLDQLNPGDPVYNRPCVTHIIGKLDIERLKSSLTAIVERHEILRTTFSSQDGIPLQEIHAPTEIPITRIDLSGEPKPLRGRKAQDVMFIEARRTFDLASGPLLRSILIRLADDEHMLLLCMHHIVFDGWSENLLRDELAAHYQALAAKRAPVLPTMTIQYGDYSFWQRQFLKGASRTALLDYWKQQLKDIQPLNLKTDRPRPAFLTHAGARETRTLNREISIGLREMARQSNATLFMTLLAAFQALLGRYTGQQDIAVGGVIAGRPRLELESLIGPFLNTLVLRTQISSNLSFRELLAQVRTVTLDAFAHQDMPFELLIAELRRTRDSSRSPLVQALFQVRNMPRGTLEVAGLEMKEMRLDLHTSKLDLALDVTETPEGLCCQFEYNPDLFSADTLCRMAQDYERLLLDVLADPHVALAQLRSWNAMELSKASPPELSAVPAEWNDTARDYPRDRCVHELFEKQAGLTPSAMAVTQDDKQLSYHDLNAQANRLGWRLRGLGVGREALVAICLERSMEMMVAMLAVLKAGGAYVPLDPTYPGERLNTMLKDCRASVLLTQRSLLNRFEHPPDYVVCLDASSSEIGFLSEENLPNCAAPESPAYVIYTSGSTGAPKGVVVTHRNVVNHNTWALTAFELQPSDRVLQFASFSFDIAVEEIFPTWMCGATLVLWPRNATLEPQEFHKRVGDLGITVLNLPTAYWHAWVSHVDDAQAPLPGALRLIVVGGEKASGESLRQWCDRAGGRVGWCNTYGPTETTVTATMYCLPEDSWWSPGEEDPPMGRPIANTRIYLLDPQMKPVQVGEVGELFIGGDGVSRGYLQRQDLTAERFLVDPFNGEEGARLYRTGDLARYLPDGNLDFIGRIDQQVKVRGFRIEPGEVEAVLERHPGIRSAVVASHGDQLVAYVVFSAKSAVEIGELRRHAGQVLPEYMVPSVYVELPSLPLTVNGKVDRKALPRLQGRRIEAGSFDPPRTQTEEVLCGIWCEVLGVERVGVRQDFFELGGHSLLATRVISRVRAVFGVEVSLRAFFESPTVAGLAAAVDAGRCDHALAVSESLRAAEQKCSAVSPGVSAFPTSFAQQRLWFLDQLNPDQTAYIVEYAIHILGPLDVTLLERALNAIVRRHESLRTAIATHSGEPSQVVSDALTAQLPVVDIQQEPHGLREARARELAAEIASRPFDLTRGPLMRQRLIRLDPEEHILAISIHHIIADGRSLSLLQEELAALYEAFSRGDTSPLTELPMQYRDFAVWQREQLQGEPLQRQLDYWKKQLDDLTPLEIPTDRPRIGMPYGRGAECKRVLPATVTQELLEIGKSEGATLFMVVSAAFKLLLHRLCSQDDISVGAPVAGRGHPAVEGLIGCFVNNLVLRTDLSGNPNFRELVGRVKETTLEALAHQEVPFERLVEELQAPRDLGRNPLFDVMINFLSSVGSRTTRSGLRYQRFDLEKTTARFALTLFISTEEDGGLTLSMVYQADLFDRNRIQFMLEQLAALLQQVADAPDRPIHSYSLVTAAMGALLPDPGLLLVPGLRHEPVTSMFLESAERTPTQTVLCQGGRQWSYGELAASAQSLAYSLVSWGLSKGDAVAISGDRCFGLVTAMLGVLMAGGVIVPIDPMFPHLRRRTMLEAAKVRSILWTGAQECEEVHVFQQIGLPIHCLDPDSGRPSERAATDTAVVMPETEPEDPAYVFFTSGTAGTPKGVLGCHKSLSHFIAWQRETFGIGTQDRIAQLTSLSFDVLLRDLFLPLTSGATLCLPEENDFYEVPQWLERMGVTVLHTVPSLVQTWLKDGPLPEGLPGLRLVFFAGEPLTESLVRRWRKAFPAAGRVVNLYGPTETTLAKCYYPVPEDPPPGIQPAGMPLPQTQILILGPGGCLCGIGEPGEIVVRTPYRTLGYLDQDAQVKSGFVANPFCDDAQDVVYHTGDRGRYRSDGLVEILGRLDDQVKIRGVRVEPAEVSAVLAQHPLLNACTVVSLVDESRPDEPHLAAYVVPTAPNVVDIEALRRHLRERLPACMLPTTFTFIEALPLTSSGKVDRKALPPEDTRIGEATAPRIAPRTTLEESLARIWCDVLKRSDISVYEDFFALGGHSLLVTQVAARVNTQFRMDLAIRRIFEESTIARLAALIERIQSASAGHETMSIPRMARSGRSPGSAPKDIQGMKT